MNGAFCLQNCPKLPSLNAKRITTFQATLPNDLTAPRAFKHFPHAGGRPLLGAAFRD